MQFKLIEIKYFTNNCVSLVIFELFYLEYEAFFLNKEGKG